MRRWNHALMILAHESTFSSLSVNKTSLETGNITNMKSNCQKTKVFFLMCDSQWLMLIGLQISGWRTIQNWPRRQKREPVVTLPVTMETYLLLAPASLQTEVCLMWRKTSTGRGVHFNTQLLIKIQQALLKIQLCFILNPTDTQLFLFFFFFLQKNLSAQHPIWQKLLELTSCVGGFEIQWNWRGKKSTVFFF